ncbi:MAG: hypothetical protein JJU40_00660 [Rhodobacteraceae bacterium]|nr:hypothetical protein [Paracoccaceae bacterium]
MNQKQYIVVNQTRDREPTEYENLLADALEQVFARGATELGEVVAGLNEIEAPSPNGQPWTDELLKTELARLGA